ncbi:NUDIX hydrolase [Pontibaca methylaminivorans]|uniref:8-oxo-dGTP pyrophosphatase MutT, NUDIX family n=1 Tax=Pontibaca methylaminivorans TaxID=515897 RepID=A0A1R3X887_9RHOB|nr:NUDIX hydrolase [Pontibaca methylaminivorans]SIT86971.1 8-oxo-dGTP pyrophosphatase MutT, NUDIX family [Pontibaca methylaminivorans]
MSTVLKKAWTRLVLPMVQRPKRVQVAALCYREDESGAKKVLLITSRGSGRWILPKGWPIDGLDGAETALREAWEEAGVKEAVIEPEPIGCYEFTKGMDTGGRAPVETYVHLARVTSLVDDYPEASERKRKWVSPGEAATMVREPELRAILRGLA